MKKPTKQEIKAYFKQASIRELEYLADNSEREGVDKLANAELKRRSKFNKTFMYLRGLP